MLFSREAARQLTKEVKDEESKIRGQRMEEQLLNQFNALHRRDYFANKEVEELLLKQKVHDLETEDYFLENNIYDIYFSPSSAGKCARELYFKAKKVKRDVSEKFPYHKRWTGNASKVHERIQEDLLYCEKVLTPQDISFTVKRLDSGLPAWERNIARFLEVEHNGVKFALYGMCDGILTYLRDNSDVLFEAKTKSTTIGTVGYYKMKGPQAEHLAQATAYSIMFGVNEVLFYYESLAKDGWTKGAEAKPDVRVFHHQITEADRQALLDRFAEITTMFRNNIVPAKEEDKCLFCPFKEACAKYEATQD